MGVLWGAAPPTYFLLPTWNTRRPSHGSLAIQAGIFLLWKRLIVKKTFEIDAQKMAYANVEFCFGIRTALDRAFTVLLPGNRAFAVILMMKHPGKLPTPWPFSFVYFLLKKRQRRSWLWRLSCWLPPRLSIGLCPCNMLLFLLASVEATCISLTFGCVLS